MYKNGELFLGRESLRNEFQYKDKWYSSNRGSWKINKLDSNKMQVEIAHTDIDMLEKWDFEINQDKINWQVSLNPGQDAEIEFSHLRLPILSKIYDEYYK